MRGQATGQNDLQMLEPDSLTLGEVVALDCDRPDLSPAYRAWCAARRCRR